MTSETGIWINPAIRNDARKSELLDMFLLNLYGAINAEDKVMLLFNVSNPESENIEQYLSKNNLFANEPTVNRGKDFTPDCHHHHGRIQHQQSVLSHDEVNL